MNAVASPRPQAVDPSSIFKKRYGNYIGGRWAEPASGQYFDNASPVNGKVFTSVPRSNAQDIEAALDAAHAARHAWGRTSTTERANVLLRIAGGTYPAGARPLSKNARRAWTTGSTV